LPRTPQQADGEYTDLKNTIILKWKNGIILGWLLRIGRRRCI